MTKHFNNSEITKQRISKWMVNAKPIDKTPTWTEKRLAIVFGAHTYIIGNGQIFQCGHCGHYDPEWSATEVISWFKENFNIDPIEIEVTCSVAEVS
jgi:hypothetical protein